MRSRAGLILLGLFLAFEALELRSYIRTESRPPSWDQAIHLEIALDYRNAIARGDWRTLWTLPPKPGMPPFPPLYHLFLTGAYAFKAPASAALWLNWAYLAVLAASLYAIASARVSGLLAAAAAMIFCLTPSVQRLYHAQLVDLAVAALAAAGYWALLKAEGFRRRPGSLAFGLVFAAGMLHKWSYFSYFIPALFLWARALRARESRSKALAAAALGLLLPAPWYAVHLPLLLPRLVGASSDYAVAFWKGGAPVYYLRSMFSDLGPWFWLLGLAGLFRLRSRLLLSWALSSYLFWTVVPNRQIRFLLPGLPPLAVAAVAAWPSPLTWGLAAAQVLAGLNYDAGWASSSWLLSDPPKAEDWKVKDILLEARARRDPDAPAVNLTIVANDVYFNAPNFTWMTKLLGEPMINVRGPNARLCELSQFVVLKTGSLGPPEVTENLPEDAAQILDPKGWFARAYAPVKDWPLPDGGKAVLYQRRAPASPPFGSRKLITLKNYSDPEAHLEGTNLAFRLGPWDARRSEYGWIDISADRAVFRGLPMDRLKIRLTGVLLIPLDPALVLRVRLLKLGGLTVQSLSVGAEAAREYLASRVKGLSIQELSIDGSVKAAALWRNIPLKADASASLEPGRLTATLVYAKAGPVPLPVSILGAGSVSLPLTPSAELPFPISLAGLSLRAGKLTIP